MEEWALAVTRHPTLDFMGDVESGAASRSQAFSGEEKAWRTALEPLVPQECVGHVIMNRNIITLRNMLSYAWVFVVDCAGADFLSIKVAKI